jgi:hypothetical protein
MTMLFVVAAGALVTGCVGSGDAPIDACSWLPKLTFKMPPPALEPNLILARIPELNANQLRFLVANMLRFDMLTDTTAIELRAYSGAYQENCE